MNKLLSSKWRLSVYAFLASFGAIIGGLLVNQSIYVVLGCLTSLVVLVLINIGLVLYQNMRKEKSAGGKSA
ncbi:hypothetical protein [Planomicrobium sp. YIM 101495]|uniref:hypothetical protein n=1 Tax=Planomicrobium sp. YIM 101495 TaxID=2665160 RepID=UPI0018ABD61B|nr:hypothetical protein [Planomicrobium sp. YIM 101495]